MKLFTAVMVAAIASAAAAHAELVCDINDKYDSKYTLVGDALVKTFNNSNGELETYVFRCYDNGICIRQDGYSRSMVILEPDRGLVVSAWASYLQDIEGPPHDRMKIEDATCTKR